MKRPAEITVTKRVDQINVFKGQFLTVYLRPMINLYDGELQGLAVQLQVDENGNPEIYVEDGIKVSRFPEYE